MKLSVVIPVYNEEDTIEEIVDRVYSASPLGKEIVIVDDASKDSTPKKLEGLKLKYPDVKLTLKEKNMGKGHTLAVGFKETTGDYVIVQDADLEYDPAEYAKLLRALEEEKVDVIYG